MLWTLKHKPRSLADVCGNAEAMEKIRTWALDWSRGISGKPLLLHGPPGSGKTAAVLAVAEEMGWELVEMNASDLRNKAAIERVAVNACGSASLFGRPKLILIDEVDGLQSKDRGGGSALSSMAKSSRQPVIFTANDCWETSLSGIRAACALLEFKKINFHSIASILEKIALKEGVQLEKKQAEDLAKSSQGDLRSAINDLQASSEGKRFSAAALSSRERDKSVFNALQKLFKTMSFSEARESLDGLDVDLDFFKKWVDENIPLEYDDPEDLARAFDVLSRADIFDGRIYRRQYWGFLRYSLALLTAGVALAKKKPYSKFVKYSFPRVIRALASTRSARALEKSIGLKVGHKCHCSIKEAKTYFPLLQAISKKSGSEKIALAFSLSEDEIAFIDGKT